MFFWKTYRYEINTDTGRFKQYDFATYDCKDAMESEDIWIVNYSEKVDIIR